MRSRCEEPKALKVLLLWRNWYLVNHIWSCFDDLMPCPGPHLALVRTSDLTPASVLNSIPYDYTWPSKPLQIDTCESDRLSCRCAFELCTFQTFSACDLCSLFLSRTPNMISYLYHGRLDVSSLPHNRLLFLFHVSFFFFCDFMTFTFWRPCSRWDQSV